MILASTRSKAATSNFLGDRSSLLLVEQERIADEALLSLPTLTKPLFPDSSGKELGTRLL